ncbi:hypothetical protein HanIR_Chr02g0067671 [Helianthus annuus]|nr:hypothetical protein HanIR_Chr02g0067671 [Helianthus annuus]
MAPGKDNLAESVSVLTQRQLDKFIQEYRIPLDLNMVLPSKNEIIYPFRQGKFPLYTRVCKFVNYRVPFSKFLIRVLRYFRVHLCHVNPFGISRINHFEISCRALDQRPDLDVFRYFYEFITTGDWYTFAHRKGVPSPAGDERSSLKNWKDNFFWLDDCCLPVEMVWRFKDQTMSFDLGEDFVFNKELARALIDNKSPIRPLPEHLLLWGWVCFSWGRGDRDWPVIRTKRERNEMSLRDALKVPNFNVLDFDFDEQVEGEIPFMKQVSSSAQEIRPLTEQSASELPTVDVTSSGPKLIRDVAGSSGSRAKGGLQQEEFDSDPEVRSLDGALKYRPSAGSLKSKGIASAVELKGLARKRKTEVPQIRSSDPLPMPKTKKAKKSSSHSSGNVITELDEHLSSRKSSREEATLASSALTPAFSGGDGKTQGEAKVVTFSGTILDSSLGPYCFIDDEEDQVSSLPPSWFGHELMSFFRYADVFADDKEIDPETADEKFVPEWDIRNKDSVMNDLTARMFLFNINTPLDHARSRKMKNQVLGAAVLLNQAQYNLYVTELYRRWVEAESMNEDLEKETLSLKHKLQRTPDTEKKLTQLSQDLQAQKEKIKSLITQSQSAQAAAASASEECDRVAAELMSFAESLKKKDEEHKEVLVKMEEFVSNAPSAYEKMLAALWSERDAHKTGEADLKAQMDEMKGHHKAEIEELKSESADLVKKVEDLQATKAWLLLEGAQLLAKNIHKGPEMTVVVATVNNDMSAIGVNSGLQNGYIHALKKKTPYAEVPLLNQNAEAELNTTIACLL